MLRAAPIRAGSALYPRNARSRGRSKPWRNWRRAARAARTSRATQRPELVLQCVRASIVSPDGTTSARAPQTAPALAPAGGSRSHRRRDTAPCTQDENSPVSHTAGRAIAGATGACEVLRFPSTAVLAAAAVQRARALRPAAKRHNSKHVLSWPWRALQRPHDTRHRTR